VGDGHTLPLFQHLSLSRAWEEENEIECQIPPWNRPKFCPGDEVAKNYEHRGELDVIPKWDLGKIKFSIRGRLELRHISGAASNPQWRVCFMPEIGYPIRIAKKDWTVFVADEFFYDITQDALNENRAFVGVNIPLSTKKKVKLSSTVYYMLQHLRDTQANWTSNSVIGLKLAVGF